MSLKSKLKHRKSEHVDLVFCLDRPLLKELESARAAARANAEGRIMQGEDAAVVALEKKVRAASVTIRITSLPWTEYNDLILQHPARDGHDEQFNAATFYAAAAKATAVEVTAKSAVPIPDEDWTEFIEGLTDGEYDRIAGAVVQVNRNLATVNTVPFA